MPKLTWYQALAEIRPVVFEVLTPNGRGTGFQLFLNDSGFCGIATAYHVIDHAHEWEEPIRLIHQASGESLVLKDEIRAIEVYPGKDLAFIFFHKNKFPIKPAPKLIVAGHSLKPGAQMGWCGFPAVAPSRQLCFFSGHVSAYLSDGESYLVDGVAINGVSGGPAFYVTESDPFETRLAGVITAYVPNRIAGESLPGLSIVRTVEPYRATLERLQSVDQAKEEAKKKSEPLPPPGEAKPADDDAGQKA